MSKTVEILNFQIKSSSSVCSVFLNYAIFVVQNVILWSVCMLYKTFKTCVHKQVTNLTSIKSCLYMASGSCIHKNWGRKRVHQIGKRVYTIAVFFLYRKQCCWDMLTLLPEIFERKRQTKEPKGCVRNYEEIVKDKFCQSVLLEVILVVTNLKRPEIIFQQSNLNCCCLGGGGDKKLLKYKCITYSLEPPFFLVYKCDEIPFHKNDVFRCFKVFK